MNTELQNDGGANSKPALSDADLSSLLRSLPHEQASLGFEERVKRRLRGDASATRASWWSRSVRVAAPLMAAAALGFVFGPDVFRHGSDPISTPTAGSAAIRAAETNDMQPMNPPRSLALEPSRALPSIAGSPQVQAVSTGSTPRGLSSPRVQQIQREAAQIRRQLEELRRQQSEAMPRVLWTTEDGVEVEIDLAEFLLMLEGGANAAMEDGVPSPGANPPGGASSPAPDSPRTGSVPPRW